MNQRTISEILLKESKKSIYKERKKMEEKARKAKKERDYHSQGGNGNIFKEMYFKERKKYIDIHMRKEREKEILQKINFFHRMKR